MFWLDRLKKYAPDLALALATGGTSAIGATALRIASKELFDNEAGTLEEVRAAVDSGEREHLEALSRANGDFVLALEQLRTQQMQMVNETMRAESVSDHWPTYSWRPFWGFVSAIAFAIVAITIAVALAALAYRDPAGFIPVMPTVIGSLASLFAIPGAILGVSAWHRGKEKRIRAGELPAKGAK